MRLSTTYKTNRTLSQNRVMISNNALISGAVLVREALTEPKKTTILVSISVHVSIFEC